MADEVMDGSADSSTATATPEATPQAAPQPDLTANGNGRPQSVPYERFQQVNARMREYERRIQEYERRQQQPQPSQPAQPLSIEDRIQQEQAAEALEKLIGQHPTLKNLIELAKHAPNLMQGYQGVQTLTHRQISNTLKTGNDRVATLAKEAGLPDKPESIQVAQDLVAGLIAKSPEHRDRLFQGDLGVVDEMFGVIKGFIQPLQRAATATTATTKLNGTATVPLRASGGPGGPPAPEKPTPENHGQLREGLRDRMRTAFASLGGQQG